jgi:cytidylate kinase
MPVVTIRGQLGSGATEVGKEVADRLHVDYVDRQVIARVAARLHRKEQEVMAKEMPPSSLLGRIVEALEQGSAYGDGLAGAYLPVSQIPLGDASYLQALESVTRELARTDAIVIQGLGSQYILKDHPGALHVLTVAPMKVRIDRVMKKLKLSREAAAIEIKSFDGSRREFVKRYFRADVENPEGYDLMVNTERFDAGAAATIIVDALSLIDGKTAGEDRPW